jgi:hypothetical protein
MEGILINHEFRVLIVIDDEDDVWFAWTADLLFVSAASGRRTDLISVRSVVSLIRVRSGISVGVRVRIAFVRINWHQILHVLRMFRSLLTTNALSGAQEQQRRDENEGDAGPGQTVRPAERSDHDAGLFEHLLIEL